MIAMLEAVPDAVIVLVAVGGGFIIGYLLSKIWLVAKHSDGHMTREEFDREIGEAVKDKPFDIRLAAAIWIACPLWFRIAYFIFMLSLFAWGIGVNEGWW